MNQTTIQSGRVAVLIDGGYLRKSTARRNNLRLDHEKLAQHLTGSGTHFRTYYHDAPPYVDREFLSDRAVQLERGFENYVRHLRRCSRTVVRLGETRRAENPTGGFSYRQKGVDVGIALDMALLTERGLVDRIVVVTADGDFVPAFKHVNEMGVSTTLDYDPDLPVAGDLLGSVDETIEMDDAFFREVTERPRGTMQIQLLSPEDLEKFGFGTSEDDEEGEEDEQCE